MTSPSDGEEAPFEEWPPHRTASGSVLNTANMTAAETSFGFAGFTTFYK